MKWMTDPKDKKPSVSLTLLIVTFLALLVVSTLHLAKLTSDPSTLLQLFYATAGLYWGRRFKTKSETSSSIQ